MKFNFRHRFLVLPFALALLLGSAKADEKVLDASAMAGGSVRLTEYFAVLEDPDESLTLEDVLKPDVAARFVSKSLKTEDLNFGFTRSAFWLRLHLKNPSGQKLARMLEINYTILSSIQFHQPVNGVYQSTITGSALPYATRPYPNRFYVFPLEMSAHSEQVVYLRIRTAGAVMVPVVLWDTQAYHAHERNDYVGQAWYFGMATAMVLFNLLLGIALRDAIYLIYVVFVSSTALAIASRGGLAKEFLWPEATLWAEISTSVGYSVTLATFLFFMRYILDTASFVPRLDRFTRVIIVALLLTPIALVISFQDTVKSITLFYVAVLLMILMIGVIGMVKRRRSAYFFMAAFGMLVLGSLLNALRAFGLLPTNFFTSNGLQLGSAIEMILLAFALADRFNIVRREKAKAQREALDAQAQALKAQEEKVSALTQLVANVAHEINTPIGAVKSSGRMVADALASVLDGLPGLFEKLESEHRRLFASLVGQVSAEGARLTSREERAIRREVRNQLEAAGIENADEKAKVLVQFNAQNAPLDYLPLLRHAESELILTTAQNIGAIVNSASNINTAVDRVSKIVTTLQAYAHEAHPDDMVDARLVDGIESVLAIYSNQIKQGTELIRQYEEVPLMRCLPVELTQVWTHLIHNALQAMNNKGRLTIALKQAGTEVMVSVTDTGSGIPPAIRERIFEPFFTTRPPGEGSGLGLDIVKKIVAKHRGRIDVKTEVGVGSTFTTYLPLNPGS